MEKYINFKEIHQGERVIVLGCGPSAKEIQGKQVDLVSIGVNDIAKYFRPDYLVVVNEQRSFNGRWPNVKDNGAKAVFTHLPYKRLPLENTVKINLGRKNGTISVETGVDYSVDSPYMAILIASFMGAREIGLIGVDFTDPNHNLHKRYGDIVKQYNVLYRDLNKRGIKLVNLSTDSILTIPKVDLNNFLSGSS